MVQINFIVKNNLGQILLYETVINFITFFFEVGGAFWSVLGVIRLATSLNEKNSPGLQSAIWQIVSGVAVILAAILFRTVNLDFELVIKLLQYGSKLTFFAGVLWCLYGVINLAESLRNTNAPTLESNIWQIVGGVFVCIASFMLNKLVIAS